MKFKSIHKTRYLCPLMQKHLFALFVFLGLVCLQCTSGEGASKDDQLLAKVYNKSLYLSDMEGMIPEGMSSEDSALIIKAFIRRWVRDAVLMHEAERNIPKDLDIDKLVRDYRASLIRENYEQAMVEQALDSTITEQELQDFYEKNKKQYILEAPIIKCRFIKIAKNVPDIEKLKTWWESEDPQDEVLMKKYCENYAIVQILDDRWQEVRGVAAYMPTGILTEDNVRTRQSFIESDDTFLYFFRLIDYKNKGDVAPLSHIRGQAKKVILHKRKLDILEDMKEKMYEEALR
ncbi:MAG: hypothetical protein D6714_16525, partial [Bacteroidetes bacterium]